MGGGGRTSPQKNNSLAVSKVSNVLAYRSNASVDWLFIILALNKGASVEEITLYQRFELLYIERKKAEIDLIVALSTKFPINLNMD